MVIGFRHDLDTFIGIVADAYIDPHRPTHARMCMHPQLFEDMRLGKLKENEATLRLKMDMTSANFNMYDQVRHLLSQ